MQELQGKVAVVTGGGSGLGRELALACAHRGMQVVLADVDEPGMQQTQGLLSSALPGSQLLCHKLDVSKLEDVQAFADEIFDRFGAVHVLFNNAGVALGGPVWQNSEKDWQWVLGVNLMGVAWGIKAFVPRMLAQTEGHIVNTASAAGWLYMPNIGIYNTSKSAVIALSETLLGDLRLAGAAIGVSVVCPGFFRTGIASSERNRPVDLTDPAAVDPDPEKTRAKREERAELLNKAFDASPVSAHDVAELTLRAVTEGRFYVFPHPAVKTYLMSRAQNAAAERDPPGL